MLGDFHREGEGADDSWANGMIAKKLELKRLKQQGCRVNKINGL
jgi:hypothetical protein